MKTIALFELLTGGHREAFMCLFTKACLENNAKVICIYPNSKEIKNWLQANTNLLLDNVIFIDFDPVFKNYNSFGRFNDAISKLAYWKYCASVLQKIEKDYNINIDLVYFNWIDSQIANYIPSSILDYIFPYKWSGLYFHPISFRITPKYLEKRTTFRDVDSIFLSKNCVAVTIHDEGILEKYQKRVIRKTILFPEIADNTLPNPNNELAKKIIEKANGRIIIGMIGLEYHKGIESFVYLCKIADPTKYFFAFTGHFNEINIANFPKEPLKKVLDFKENLPENCLWQTGGLKEGEEYNSIFCSFDIIHIVYKSYKI